MIPDWLFRLQPHDEFLLYFPYTGNTAWAEFISIDLQYAEVELQYIWNGKVKRDVLTFSNYTMESNTYDNWYAYQVNKK